MTPRTSRVQLLQSGLPQVRQKATAATSLCVAQFIRTSCTWSPTLQADRDNEDMSPGERWPESDDYRSDCSCAPASARAVVLCRSCPFEWPVETAWDRVRRGRPCAWFCAPAPPLRKRSAP